MNALRSERGLKTCYRDYNTTGREPDQNKTKERVYIPKDVKKNGVIPSLCIVSASRTNTRSGRGIVMVLPLVLFCTQHFFPSM